MAISPRAPSLTTSKGAVFNRARLHTRPDDETAPIIDHCTIIQMIVGHDCIVLLDHDSTYKKVDPNCLSPMPPV